MSKKRNNDSVQHDSEVAAVIYELAETVQAKRKALGWTQSKLAEEADVNVATVGVWRAPSCCLRPPPWC